MTGAWTDPARGLVSVIVLEMGGSSDLCALLQPGEPVVLMGPTGTPTEIHADTTVALVGGGLGNAVLFSIGAALRAAGSRVIYFAGYKQVRDRYKVAEIERAADVDRLVLRRGAGLRADPTGRRTATSSATSCRRWRPTAPASWARRRCRCAEADASDRHRLGPHDAGGRRGAPWRAGAVSASRATPRSARSTRRCNA